MREKMVFDIENRHFFLKLIPSLILEKGKYFKCKALMGISFNPDE